MPLRPIPMSIQTARSKAANLGKQLDPGWIIRIRDAVSNRWLTILPAGHSHKDLKISKELIVPNIAIDDYEITNPQIGRIYSTAVINHDDNGNPAIRNDHINGWTQPAWHEGPAIDGSTIIAGQPDKRSIGSICIPYLNIPTTNQPDTRTLLYGIVRRPRPHPTSLNRDRTGLQTFAEFPRGFANPGEHKPDDVAIREFKEEIGAYTDTHYNVSNIQTIGYVNANTALFSSHIAVVALGIIPSGKQVVSQAIDPYEPFPYARAGLTIELDNKLIQPEFLDRDALENALELSNPDSIKCGLTLQSLFLFDYFIRNHHDIQQ